jgi:hypothetical protein
MKVLSTLYVRARLDILRVPRFASICLSPIKLPWEKLSVNLLESMTLHMRVDLGRSNIGVPQHRLNGSEIGASLEQMRGKRMSEHVRRDRLRNPGASCPLQKQLPTSLPCEPVPTATHEEDTRRSAFE